MKMGDAKLYMRVVILVSHPHKVANIIVLQRFLCAGAADTAPTHPHIPVRVSPEMYSSKSNLGAILR